MKKQKRLTFYFFTIILLSSTRLLCQEENNLAFVYDKAGNLIERKTTGFPSFKIANPFSEKDSIAIERQESFKVFPNPTHDYLTIEGNLPKNISEAKIQISDLNGRVLKTDLYSDFSKTINIVDLPNGMYLLELIYYKKERNTYKIIVN